MWDLASNQLHPQSNGSGLRLTEAIRLRVQDIDFSRKEILIRDGKGFKDRITMLPDAVVEPLRENLRRVKKLHQKYTAKGFGTVFLPYALERKYPQASKEWIWQWAFPARRLSADPRSGIIRRHHISDSSVQKAIRQATIQSRIPKRITPHTFRHSFGRPFGRLINASQDAARCQKRVFSPWRLREPSISGLVSFQGT